MVFVNRRQDLGRIAQLARDVTAGPPERHLAFVGVRRIGKSRLVEHYRDHDPALPVAYVRMDSAATTLPIFLWAMVRATVNGLARFRGQPELGKEVDDTEILARAAALDPVLVEHVSRARRAAAARRPDGQHLLEVGLSFPELAAGALKQPLLVVADEFQHILGLASYAPFGGRASGLPRRTDVAAHEALLGVVRATIERPPHVGWVVTGSSVRLLKHLLGQGPLMGRFDVVPIPPFDQEDCVTLAEAVWEQTKTAHHPRAATQVFRLSQGQPFYADVTCREAATIARQFEQPVTPEMVGAAFAAAIHLPLGQINSACKEMYDSLTVRAPGLRGFLDALAIQEPASVTEVAERMGLGAATPAYRFAEELSGMGMIEEEQDGYVFSDPVFRYWVARVNDPATSPPAAFSPDILRRLARTYEEAYLRERDVHGHLSEGFLRDLCRSFRGQQVDGGRLGRPGTQVRLPEVDEVTSIEAIDPTGETLDRPGEPVRVQLDLRFGRDAVWLGEVKRTTDRATVADILRLVRKAAFLRRAHGLPPGPAWFVSFAGFDQSARDAARDSNVYFSGVQDLNALHAATGVLR